MISEGMTMINRNRDINEWKREYIECFNSCLELYGKDSREYRQLKICIEELRKL